MKTILASDEATPSRELSRPLNVSLPIPWYAKGSESQNNKNSLKVIFTTNLKVGIGLGSRHAVTYFLLEAVLD